MQICSQAHDSTLLSPLLLFLLFVLLPDPERGVSKQLNVLPVGQAIRQVAQPRQIRTGCVTQSLHLDYQLLLQTQHNSLESL